MNESCNPLDPTLELAKTMEDKNHVYFLVTEVTDRCIIDTPEVKYEKVNDQVNLTIVYSLYPKASPRRHQKTIYEITINPEGLDGEIMVLIQDSNPTELPDKDFGPKADGKAIIRFEKAKMETNEARKSTALEKAKSASHN